MLNFLRSLNTVTVVLFASIENLSLNEIIVQLIKRNIVQFCIIDWQACRLRMSQFSCLNYVINNTNRKFFFDTRWQDVVNICLEMFNCISAKQICHV